MRLGGIKVGGFRGGLTTRAGVVVPAPGGGFTPPAGLLQWHYGNNTEAGGEWTDQSGNGNHATLNGSAIVGVNGLTGGTSVGDFADIVTSINSLTYSMAGWLNVASGSLADVGCFGPSSGTSSIFWADYQTGPTWRIASNSPVVYGATSSDIRGVWVHLAWASSAGSIKMFINGAEDGSGAAPSGSLFTRIGVAGSGKPLRSSFLDDVMIFPTTALSGADILNIYNNSPGTHKP